MSRAPAPPVVVWTGPKPDSNRAYRQTSKFVRRLAERARPRSRIVGYRRTSETLDAMRIWAARSRGVDVLVTASASKTTAGDEVVFRAEGIRLKSIAPSEHGFPKFHAKAIVADGSDAIVGPVNFTNLVRNHNVELGFLVEGEIAATLDHVLRSYLASTGWIVSR